MNLIRPVLIAVLTATLARADSAPPAASAPVAPAASASSATTPTGVFFSGINDGNSAWYGYAGTVYSLGGDLDSSGWVLRALAGTGQYTYTTPAAAGTVRGSIFDSTVGFGYKYADSTWNLTGTVGPNFRDKSLNETVPGDGSDNRGGASFNLDFFALANSVSWSVLGQYSTLDNASWDRARVGYLIDTNRVTVGPEVSYNHDGVFNEYRVGPFVSFPIAGSLSASFSTGYSDASVNVPGARTSHSAYADLGISVAY